MNFPRYQPAGDGAILVTFADQINLTANQKAHTYALALREQPLPGLGEAVPGYITLLVYYDPMQLDYSTVERLLRELGEREDRMTASRWVEVPVVYGGIHGPDLKYVAEHAGLPEDEVIRLHARRDYPVFMMGFTPGFPYLGGVDPRIAAPRLETPRNRVPAGSVGIAGEQTGVYPLESPGGWRIIGRTTLSLFDPLREPPFLIHPGDTIRFVPVGESLASEGET